MEADAEARVMSTEAAARRLGGISVNSLRKLPIPTVRFAGRVMYRVEDLDEFIDNNTYEAV